MPSAGRFLGLVLATPPSGARSPPASLPAVLDVSPGSPAARARIRAGDRLVAVGDRSCDGMPAGEANRLLWVGEGRSVELHLRSAGGAIRVVGLR